MAAGAHASPLSAQAAPQALRDCDSGMRGSGGAARDSGAEAAELLGKALGCVAVACRQVEQAAALAPEAARGLVSLGSMDALVVAVLPSEGTRVRSHWTPLFCKQPHLPPPAPDATPAGLQRAGHASLARPGCGRAPVWLCAGG